MNGPPLSRPLLVMLDGVLVRSGLPWECLLAILPLLVLWPGRRRILACAVAAAR